MLNQKRIILGISPGAHTMGIALLKEKELVDWRMKVFNENWSEVKLEKIITSLHEIISKYEVTIIALKVLHPARCSDGLKELLEAIIQLAKSQEIALYSCTIRDIKGHCSLEKESNKGVIVEYVLQKHPELLREYQQEQGNSNPYYIKIFEAVAAARLCDENM